MSQNKRTEKFVELAESRTQRIVDDLRLLGNLWNRSNYEYTDEQAKKIISEVEKHVRQMKSRYEAAQSLRRGSTKQSFSLDGDN